MKGIEREFGGCENFTFIFEDIDSSNGDDEGQLGKDGDDGNNYVGEKDCNSPLVNKQPGGNDGYFGEDGYSHLVTEQPGSGDEAVLS